MTASDEPRRCARCGAASSETGARFCARCGSELAPEPPPDPFGDVAARFRSARARPELAGWLAEVPQVPELAGKTSTSLLALAGLAFVGLLLAAVFLQLCAPLAFVPLALVVFGGYALATGMRRDSRAPLQSELLLVRELRTRLQVGARHAPELARQEVVLERDDGARLELDSVPSARVGLKVGALGVAHRKGGRLVAFRSVD